MDFKDLPNEEFYAFEERLRECLKRLALKGPKGLLIRLEELKPWVDREWGDRYPDFDLEDELKRRGG